MPETPKQSVAKLAAVAAQKLGRRLRNGRREASRLPTRATPAKGYKK